MFEIMHRFPVDNLKSKWAVARGFKKPSPISPAYNGLGYARRRVQ